jgi:hypothetical protein
MILNRPYTEHTRSAVHADRRVAASRRGPGVRGSGY